MFFISSLKGVYPYLAKFQYLNAEVAKLIVGAIAYTLGIVAYFIWCFLRLLYGVVVACCKVAEPKQPFLLMAGLPEPSQAPTEDLSIPALTKMLLVDLRKLASKKGIPGRSKMNKLELVNAIAATG